MARGKQSRGQCRFCGYETTKGSMTKHINACPEYKAQITTAEQSKHPSEIQFYLRAYDAYGPAYWLDLEARGTAKLKDIDGYLRAIWLECCGHLSEFSVGSWGGTQIAKTRTVQSAFEQNPEITHIYDFGTSSETKIKLIGVRQGASLTDKPITLLARNLMPEALCLECGKPAAYLCMECLIEDQADGYLCEKHARKHPHTDYGDPIELVNSPRLGMCGYEGPAEPPY